MNLAAIIPQASSWGIGTGWWVVMAVFMVLCMGAMGMMMLGMMRHWASGGWPRWPRWPDWPGRRTETASDVLRRRFAEGEISVEEYRERRAILTNGTRQREQGAGDREREVVPATTREEES